MPISLQPPPLLPHLHSIPAPKGRREKKSSICDLTHLCVYEETCPLPPPLPPFVHSFCLFIHSGRKSKSSASLSVIQFVLSGKKERKKYKTKSKNKLFYLVFLVWGSNTRLSDLRVNSRFLLVNVSACGLESGTQQLCESRGGRPGLPVPNSPYSLCGRKATLNLAWIRAQGLCECRGGRTVEVAVPNGPYSLCGRKATLKWKAQELGSCVKVEVVVLGSPSLTVLMVSVDVKQHWTWPDSELRSCVNVEVAVLGSPSLTVLMVSVDVTLQWPRTVWFDGWDLLLGFKKAVCLWRRVCGSQCQGRGFR